MRQVLFMDGTSSYVPEDQIEQIEHGPQDPLELLERGRLGGVGDLQRTLTHVRLTGRLADIIYSMDTTGTDFYAYQFKPVIKLLNSTSTGILIADEVGLGKTIEAGLIWTELRSRFDFRRIFVVCPAVLREKWERELRIRFGVRADVVDANGALQKLRIAAEEGSRAQFAIIASMQGLRPRRGWHDRHPDHARTGAIALAHFLEQWQQEDPLIDLAIIDEAHYMRNPETMTSQLGRLLRDVSHYVVLLSATPVHLRSEDLFQLVNLVDADTFSHPQAFDDILDANAPLVRLREALLAGSLTPDTLSSSLEDAQRHPLLRGNRQLDLLRERRPSREQLEDSQFVSHMAYRLETANLLGHVVTRTRKRDVVEWRVIREVHAEEIEITPLERKFYETVTGVVRDYCALTAAHEGFLLVMPQRQMASSMPAALRYWQLRANDSEDVYEALGVDDVAEDLPDTEPGPLLQEVISRVDELGDLQLLWEHDSKYRRLLGCLNAFFAEHRQDKLILFSYFRPTLDYLRERLERDGIPCMVLKGGMPDKDAVIAQFRDREGPLVLLSSEVGGEGVDLQFAWAMINYDLPWNPMRIEQRIGRIDRLGQQSPKVVVWNMFCAGTIDARIYRRLFERLKIFTRTLGGLEPVLGDHIRGLTMDLFRNRLTPEQEEQRIEQTSRALENIRRHEEDLESEAAHLVAYGDYILNHIKAAREPNRRIDGPDIYTYVTDFFKLNYPGCEFRQRDIDSAEFDVSLSNDAKHDLESYVRQRRIDGLTQMHRHRVRTTQCRFENSAISEQRSHFEVISQFHPLVRFASDRINQQHNYFHPAIAVELDQSEALRDIAPGIYVFSVQRWSFRGLQDIERLYFAAALLSEPDRDLKPEQAEKLITTAARAGRNWLAAREEVDLAMAGSVANDHCLAKSDKRHDEFVEEARAQNLDRADIQERTLDRHYANQMRRLKEVRQMHLDKGRPGLVKATEGRIQALEDRVARRRREIAERREVKHARDEICVGIVALQAAEREDLSWDSENG